MSVIGSLEDFTNAPSTQLTEALMGDDDDIDLGFLDDEVDNILKELNLFPDSKDADEEGVDVLEILTKENVEDKSGSKVLTDSEVEIERNKVITELLDTERDYVRDLNTIIQKFINPLKMKKQISSLDTAKMFSNIDIIYDINCGLLKKLETRKGSHPQVTPIGDVFAAQDLDFMLSAYTGYCNDQSAAFETFNVVKKKSAFASFLKEVKEDPECRNLDLIDFLLKPMQRICKYPLLFKELLKWTPRSHNDHENIQRALDSMTKVVVQINETKRESENLKRILEIESSLVGAESLKLMTGTRKFYKAGKLIKISKGHAQQRMFWLFSDMLLYGKPLLLKKQSYEYKGLIPFDKMVVKDLPDKQGYKYSFSISRIDKKKTYILFARSDESKLLWMRAFNMVKSDGSPSVQKKAGPGAVSFHEEEQKVAFKIIDEHHDDSQLRKMEIQTSMEGAEKMPVNPTRVLMKEGKLDIIERHKEDSTDRISLYFFMFDDILVYTEILMNKKKRYAFKGYIPLDKALVVTFNDKDDGVVFDIVRYDTKTKYTVAAISVQDKRDWIRELDNVISKFLAKEKEKDKGQTDSQFRKLVKQSRKSYHHTLMNGTMRGGDSMDKEQMEALLHELNNVLKPAVINMSSGSEALPVGTMRKNTSGPPPVLTATAGTASPQRPLRSHTLKNPTTIPLINKEDLSPLAPLSSPVNAPRHPHPAQPTKGALKPAQPMQRAAQMGPRMTPPPAAVKVSQPPSANGRQSPVMSVPKPVVPLRRQTGPSVSTASNSVAVQPLSAPMTKGTMRPQITAQKATEDAKKFRTNLVETMKQLQVLLEDPNSTCTIPPEEQCRLLVRAQQALKQLQQGLS